jgi:hypothetical protein
MNKLFVVANIIFLSIAVFFSIKYKESPDKMKENVLMYSVIPSLIFSVIGHFFLSDKVRQSMGWSEDKGVITLQRELGLFTLALLGVAIFKKTADIGLIWALFLVAAGINHIFVNKGVDGVSSMDLLYGSLLAILFFR